MISKANENASRRSKTSAAGQSVWAVKLAMTLLSLHLERWYRITDFAQGARETALFNKKTIST
jgi:hypothetical protein